MLCAFLYFCIPVKVRSAILRSSHLKSQNILTAWPLFASPHPFLAHSYSLTTSLCLQPIYLHLERYCQHVNTLLPAAYLQVQSEEQLHEPQSRSPGNAWPDFAARESEERKSVIVVLLWAVVEAGHR